MTALIEKIAQSSVSRKLAQFLVPHHHNNHHPYLIRHQGLFAITLVILVVQFFSFSDITSARVLGYGTDINRSTIISLTNQERTSRGLKALKESTKLNESARQKGQHMFEHDYWSHFAPDGTSPWYFFKSVKYDYNWAGENLARDFSTSAGVVAGWMGSQGHRDNMLNPNFTEIGISVQNGTLQGEETTLVVEHLGQTLGASTPSSNSSNSNQSSKTADSTPVTLNQSFEQQDKKQNTATASANVKKIQERIASAVSPSFDLGAFWSGLALGQKTTVVLLGILLALFIFDSVILFRKGKMRHNSQSLLHAGVVAVLIVAIMRSATGGIL